MVIAKSSFVGLLVVAVVSAGPFFPARPALAGGGGCHAAAITDQAGVRVEVNGYCYEPTVLRVEQGQRVEWTNRDQDAHTVTGVNGAWGDVTQFSRDESVDFRFDAPGVYPYFCALHPGMIGTVVVEAAEDLGVEPAASASLDASEFASIGETTSAGVVPGLVWLAPVVLASVALGALVGVTRRRTDV